MDISLNINITAASEIVHRGVQNFYSLLMPAYLDPQLFHVVVDMHFCSRLHQ